jgi:hypothetical protein
MIDGQHGDTGDATLEAAGAAIESLLSGEPEDKKTREAPRKSEAPTDTEVETDTAETTDGSEEEQPTPEDESDEIEEEPEPTEPEPRKLRVKVAGEELELPEDEVVKGYSRQADYTRKTQELAKEREAFSTEADAVRAERQRYASQLAKLEEVLTHATPAEPDWDTLREGDPAVFAATYAAWDQRQKEISAVSAERARADQKVQADNLDARRNLVKQEGQKLVAAIPSWSDPEIAKTEQKAIAEYARSLGFEDDDLNAVTDHRLVLLLRDGMNFRKAEKSKPAIDKKIEKARVVAPGSPATRREVSELTRAKQALAKTHSLKDAGDAIDQLLFNSK